MTLVHENELVGTDKPIVDQKEEGMFTFDELVYLYENTPDYEHVAYLDKGTDFYDKLYTKRNQL